MDNEEFLYKGDSEKSFVKAIELIFDDYKATHYYEIDGEFTFCYGEQKGYGDKLGNIKLPVPLNAKAAAGLAWEWLINQPRENRKEPFDGDGSTGLGFKVYIKYPYNGWSYEICTVQPIWAWYSK